MEILIFWLLCGVGAALIASSKGGSGVMGFIVGALFGPFGLLFALFMGGDKEKAEKALSRGELKKCPMCAEMVQSEAQICKHCQHSFAAA